MEKQITGGEGAWNAEVLDKLVDVCKDDTEKRLTAVRSILGRHLGPNKSWTRGR